MKYYLPIAFLLIFGIIVGCEKEEDEPCVDDGTYLKVTYQAKFGNENLSHDSIYRNYQNFPIKIEKVNFFTTGFTLIEGTDSFKLDKAFLYRNNLDESVLSHTFTVDTSGDFSNFSFNVGVGEPENTSDPTTYGQSNHLSAYQSADMHWTWNTGYIFLKIEGKYDTIPGSTATPLNFAWHVGMNQFLTPVEKDVPLSIVAGQTNTLNMYFDIEKVFDNGGSTVNVKENPVIHTSPGQEVVVTKIINNFANAIEVY